MMSGKIIGSVLDTPKNSAFDDGLLFQAQRSIRISILSR